MRKSTVLLLSILLLHRSTASSSCNICGKDDYSVGKPQATIAILGGISCRDLQQAGQDGQLQGCHQYPELVFHICVCFQQDQDDAKRKPSIKAKGDKEKSDPTNTATKSEAKTPRPINPPCNVCGGDDDADMMVTSKYTLLQFPDGTISSCGALEKKGLHGDYTERECRQVQQDVREGCSCATVTKQPTPAPVMSNTIVPLDVPLQECSICGAGNFVSEPSQWVERPTGEIVTCQDLQRGASLHDCMERQWDVRNQGKCGCVESVQQRRLRRRNS